MPAIDGIHCGCKLPLWFAHAGLSQTEIAPSHCLVVLCCGNSQLEPTDVVARPAVVTNTNMNVPSHTRTGKVCVCVSEVDRQSQCSRLAVF